MRRPDPDAGPRRRRIVRRLVALAGVLACVSASGEPVAPPDATAPENPAVRLLGGGSGRFEVVARPGPDGVRLAELADRAWKEWVVPLGLPSRLQTAIMVRLVPESEWGFGAAAARTAADLGGVVSVWIRAGAETGAARDRAWLTALAEGALRRKAFLLGHDPVKANAPRWLAAAAAEAALVENTPAMLDAWQAALGGDARPAALRDVLLWDAVGGSTGTGERARAAFGIWLWLREESGSSGAWDRFLSALLGGESPGAALAREYARVTPRPREAREWELAWQVAAARLAAARSTPMMTAEESRRRLERLARVVVMDPKTGEERVAPSWGEWSSRQEAWPAAVREERARVLVADFDHMHPFYRNAAGSLGRAWTALAAGQEAAWREASVEWSRDFADGRILEDASRALLDKADGG